MLAAQLHMGTGSARHNPQKKDGRDTNPGRFAVVFDDRLSTRPTLPHRAGRVNLTDAPFYASCLRCSYPAAAYAKCREAKGPSETRRDMGRSTSEQMRLIAQRAEQYTRPAAVDSTVETRVIKEDDLFVLTDVDGNIPPDNGQGLGLYLRDTRFLSTYELRIAGVLPTLLHSSAEKNCLLTVDLTNPDISHGESEIRGQTVSISRSRIVREAVYERITFTNYSRAPINVPVSLRFGADYRDIFEVRKYKTRDQRGTILPTAYGESSMTLSYRGRDGLARSTLVHFGVKPERLEDQTATFMVRLTPDEEAEIYLEIVPQEGDQGPELTSYQHAHFALERSYGAWLQGNTYVSTTSDLFDQMFTRSVLDLRLLLTNTECGPVVTAGTPWYACVFGRDSLITALQSIIYCPDLARATLRYLARYQGTEVREWKEEQPGKIFHELRRGEMAQLGEVPHTPYYGTHDATLLWLILLAETFRWTGDRELVDDLWPAANLALEWIDRYGDRDGDGYVEYWCHTAPKDAINHGWKDSPVAVFHPNGSLADQPVALVELQAYVYAAKLGMADLCQMRGDLPRAAALRADAEALRSRFNQDFWMEEKGYLAFALDGEKRQVKTVTSNPGQALWAGIVEPELAQRVARRFMQSDLLSGWGLRCVSANELGYNPMGYHLGTVWPFDVSMIVAGLRCYGYVDQALTVATQLYRAGLNFLYYRFPEVFTGFSRTHNPFPVPYPVSCSPQAWSAGTTLLLIQTFLGISPDAGAGRVRLDPALPRWLSALRISNLRIGDARLDLRFMRHGETSTAQVLAKEGRLEVMI